MEQRILNSKSLYFINCHELKLPYLSLRAYFVVHICIVYLEVNLKSFFVICYIVIVCDMMV